MNYDDEDDSKVYMFYFNKKLYGWTTSKTMRDFFITERNMDAFKLKKKKMEPNLFRAFCYKYKANEIIEIPLESGGNPYTIHGTYYEDDKLSLRCDEILKDFESLDIFFNHAEFEKRIPDKYMKSIWLLVENFYTINKDSKDRTNAFNVDSLSIFYNLFKFTF